MVLEGRQVLFRVLDVVGKGRVFGWKMLFIGEKRKHH
jgi:hypothetical protein